MENHFTMSDSRGHQGPHSITEMKPEVGHLATNGANPSKQSMLHWRFPFFFYCAAKGKGEGKYEPFSEVRNLEDNRSVGHTENPVSNFGKGKKNQVKESIKPLMISLARHAMKLGDRAIQQSSSDEVCPTLT